MFESDDFDQILSQFDLPEVPCKPLLTSNQDNVTKNTTPIPSPKKNIKIFINNSLKPNGQTSEAQSEVSSVDDVSSPRQRKRTIINSFFDRKQKRKFPGPAGLLTGTLEETNDESICEIELLSQDIDYSQNQARREIFESPLWSRLSQDVRNWNLGEVEAIKKIKQQALVGNLRRRKAQIVTAFVEAVDRSGIDPLVILRDNTGVIKCTLHRDAWSAFSTYIASEYCAIVLYKPTILTTGSAFKKHYLNITLGNIFAIYSSAILTEDNCITLPGYVKESEDNFTVIRIEKSLQDTGTKLDFSSNGDTSDLLDDLENVFSDELF